MPKIPKSDVEAAQRLSSGASTDAIREAPRLLGDFAARTLQGRLNTPPTVERSSPPTIQVTEITTQRAPFLSNPSAAPSVSPQTPGTALGPIVLTLSKNGVATDYNINGEEA